MSNPVLASDTAATRAAPAWRLDAGQDCLWLSGDWALAQIGLCEAALREIGPVLRELPAERSVTIDLSGVSALDSFGAALLLQLRELAAGRLVLSEQTLPDHLRELLQRVLAVSGAASGASHGDNVLVRLLIRLGAGGRFVWREAVELIGFMGLILRVLLRSLLHPGRIRWHALVRQMEITGIDALPIVGLLSLLIGMVLAYLSAVQLKTFGAEILVVNIIGLAVLREIGVLLAAIILAGRSGSAFTAQIGTMKVNQEIDAMQTIGLDVVEVLVLPRVLGLVATLPLVSFYAAMAGLLGGALVCYLQLDIGPGIFLQQLKQAVDSNDMIVTFIKAPVFAFAVAMVGCFQGLKVTGSAQSVGEMTTRSVVVAICLVILLDAFFSILFQEIGL